MKKVCVLFGGESTEHIVSLRSACNIIDALDKAGYEVCCTGITEKGQWIPYEGETAAILDGTWERCISTNGKNQKAPCSGKGVTVKDFLVSVMGCEPDIIFPAVHGINCEDGILQGLLELSKIAYVGCDVLSSAAAMKKSHAKQIFTAAGIPQCKSMTVSREEIENNKEKTAEKIEKTIGFPCFLKPDSGGSSVGTFLAENIFRLKEGLSETSKYDKTVLVEEFIDCREIEVAVMGNDDPKASQPGEILMGEDVEYYDYKTKYFDSNSAEPVVPAKLTCDQKEDFRNLAVKAFKSLGCSGLARVDFFLDKKDGRILINEVNTMPGFTPISLFPKAWEAEGIPVEKLVAKLCELALERKNKNTRLEIYDDGPK